MNIKDKYHDIFLVERTVEDQKTKRITLFFLLKKQKDVDMIEFMKNHKITTDVLKEHPNEIMDFYNDMIKFQNEQQAYLNHLTIFSYSDNDLLRYLADIEKNREFVKWITIEDKDWLDKIYKYFLSKEWFINSDNKPLYKR